MEGYLGTTVVRIEDSPYADFDPADWALYWIESYGGIDGAHHKTWVLDQAARSLHGVVPIISIARWDNGYEEWRISNWDETSNSYRSNPEYEGWVASMRGEWDEENECWEYDYDEGIPP